MKSKLNKAVELLFLLFAATNTRYVTGGDSATDDTSKLYRSTECGVYFAESTIPGAGWGMFAGKNFTKGSQVTHGDIALPIVEIDWHNGFESWSFLWDDYVWGAAQITYMSEEVGGEQLSVASFGIGAAINCRLNLVNVVDNWMRADNAGLHRSKDPGVGAFTPYHDRRSFAIKPIDQGAELYMSYGENYFETRTSEYGLIPLSKNYERADKLLQKYQVLRRRIREMGLSHELQEALWDLIANNTFSGNSRTINALPKYTNEIEKALKTGTKNLNYYESVRPIEWLQENGKCMDNIRPGLSTIAQAGRGAFATRFIPKGGIVAPAPLIHIPDKKRFLMYDSLTGRDGKLRRNESAIVHSQLFLNYCFGHRDSSILLSPYGSLTGLINHSSKRPNARIQWAANNTMRHPEWMDISVHDLARKRYAGLVFDYIALEDIQEGDEVLIDFGVEWENAWVEHVRNWVPPKNSENYRPGFELTDDLDLRLWPYFEKPYYDASKIQVWCYDAYRDINGLAELKEKSDYHLARIAKHYFVDDLDMYMVELIERRGDRDQDNMTYCTETLLEVLFWVPKDAIYIEDDPYTRDIHMFSTFRHEMMIPDDMFPNAWKNRG